MAFPKKHFYMNGTTTSTVNLPIGEVDLNNFTGYQVFVIDALVGSVRCTSATGNAVLQFNGDGGARFRKEVNVNATATAYPIDTQFNANGGIRLDCNDITLSGAVPQFSITIPSVGQWYATVIYHFEP